MMRSLACLALAWIGLAANSFAQESTTPAPSANGVAPVSVPLTMVLGSQGSLKALLEVGIGGMSPLPITLDTGSVGLRLFDPTPNDLNGNGITCYPGETTTVTYGNPARVEYGGDICTAAITIGDNTGTGQVMQTQVIPFALLKVVLECYTTSCPTPQTNYANQIYGVFGAGLGSGADIPNPLRALPNRYGQRFMLRLNSDVNEPSSLVLAPHWNYQAVVFPQGQESIGYLNLPTYGDGYACITWQQGPATFCPQVVFDTGNSVPWFHATIPGLSPAGDYVPNGNTFTLEARVGGPPAVSLTSNSTIFMQNFRYEDQSENLVNMAIQAFLGNDVIYDGEQGLITIAPTPVVPLSTGQ
jgi:hypothetical protein